jgi:hypothetical protein
MLRNGPTVFCSVLSCLLVRRGPLGQGSRCSYSVQLPLLLLLLLLLVKFLVSSFSFLINGPSSGEYELFGIPTSNAYNQAFWVYFQRDRHPKSYDGLSAHH